VKLIETAAKEKPITIRPDQAIQLMSYKPIISAQKWPEYCWIELFSSTQSALSTYTYRSFREAVNVEMAPVSNERKQIRVVDRIAVNIDVIMTYHQ